MSVLSGMFERLAEASMPKPPDLPVPTPSQPTEPRFSHWRVVLDGKSLCSMIGEPMTKAEALKEVRYRWPNALVMHPESGNPGMPSETSQQIVQLQER